jgi:hypothetical protein
MARGKATDKRPSGNVTIMSLPKMNDKPEGRGRELWHTVHGLEITRSVLSS